VFREWEQKFSTSNSLRQALSQTKGITLPEAQMFFEKGLALLGDPAATQESLIDGMRNVMYAAANEYAPALNFLGNVSLEKARSGQDSYSSAVYYYKNAVKLGNIESIYSLGCLIMDGEGFAQNYNIAQGYISLAALQGIPDAQYRFAEMLDKGNGVIQNKHEATVWYKKALDGGDRRAYLPLAFRYLEGDTVNRNETVAAQYFTEAAEDGSTDAILMLAKLYRDGVGVKKDPAKSEVYFRKAAESEIAEAQYEYALILQSKKNYTEAFKWLSYAAIEREYGEKPMPAVLFKLGQCYGMGLGTETDRQTAFLYYHRAALAGDVNARAAVADCYKRGIGVTVNKRAAEYFAYGMQ
jgi:TPR repeat protein